MFSNRYKFIIYLLIIVLNIYSFFIRIVVLDFFFFFSSRRRHTRYWRDWSSDVCSSDLPQRLVGAGFSAQVFTRSAPYQWLPAARDPRVAWLTEDVDLGAPLGDFGLRRRSEERRVGKECRSRWSPYH